MMKSAAACVFTVVFLVLPCLGAEEMTPLTPAVDDLLEQLGRVEEVSVAVVDFTDLRGGVLELGRFLAEEVSVVLVRDQRTVRVVTRTRLNALLQEHQLTPTGLIDPEEVKELGLVSGVDVLITGTVTPLGDVVRLSLQALDTETGDVLGASTADIPRSLGIDKLMQREVHSTVGSSAQGVGDYQGRLVSQQIEHLSVDLLALELISAREIRLTLNFRNTNREGRGLAVAWSAVGSGGLADYWKFFPRVDAVLTDDRGNKFEYRTSSGPGFARTQDDWLVLSAGAEAKVSVSLWNSDRAEPGSVFSFSAPIRLAWNQPGSRKPRANIYSIFLKDIRPKL